MVVLLEIFLALNMVKIRYDKQYLNEHPPLFVIGSKKPGVKCLWFNTGDGSETTENTITEILADSAGNTIYAEVAE